jgi:hypothetical protein
VELKATDLDPRFQHILEDCEAYLVTYPGNLSALDTAPFGFAIPEENIFDPTTLRSRTVIDCLHHLDAFSFGGQDMLMPRWVLFDCGEFPGMVYGFGKKAKDLDDEVREAYHVTDAAHDDTFIPLSMWVALRCAEDGAWFGHNLSSANLVATQNPWPGLATITKAFGVRLTKGTKQYGATQWSSGSLNIHLSLGAMNLLCAYTPAHTHPETFAYRIDVDAERLAAPLLPGWTRPNEGGDRYLDAGDSKAIREFHAAIEGGAKHQLYRVERRPKAPQRLWIKDL